jgi:hypothetical protein
MPGKECATAATIFGLATCRFISKREDGPFLGLTLDADVTIRVGSGRSATTLRHAILDIRGRNRQARRFLIYSSSVHLNNSDGQRS